ncbi:lipopolysaccharide assembly protein LapB [Allochromatium vinosum]|uniref:Lipopolysaccharide assembly protein B n=1 Tax=Allochromatium vinosum (strain ATCC 17899 / DSM 180 / NBRC 103801 / NCIMB 10441 / D) TaxID=572477 RepID=D3RMR9_ALLVD|nr:lipopolysaccharide assembly protein LapB [Allochromatium vinosum]ADC63207.1 tetratricopeptide repeat protein [Allochromatium vinosum DSM 180]
MIELFFLLLPVAAASGWWLARRDLRRKIDVLPAAHPDFLRGLNYLLEEQPDKAIDLFLRLTEVDSETAETHLALGSLFRRRGEVDRAIRLHQNLIERRHLGPELRGFALFELGQDYMSAGLLDRAETLFEELVGLGLHGQRALQALREIYQRERDWSRCLEVAAQLEALTGQRLTVEIAHYHCELAEEARRRQDPAGAREQLSRARDIQSDCVRATILEGFMVLEEDDVAGAAALFKRVAERGATYVPEILPALIESMERLGENVIAQLEALAANRAGPHLMLALGERVEQAHGSEAALDLLADYLARWADLAVLERFLDLRARESDPDGRAHRYARVALGVARHLLQRQSVYQCEQCGFQARSLHWQCPSCRNWGTVVAVLPDPIQGEATHPPV